MGELFDISVLSGISAGDVFHFDFAQVSSITIGRDTGCDLLLQDPLVSRKHAQIERRGLEYFIIDLESTHGTFHMGFPLKSGPEAARKLSDGDEFKIGDLLFRVNFETNSSKAELELSTAQLDAARSLQRASSKTLSNRVKLLVLLCVLGLLYLYIAPGSGSNLPPQRSNEVITLPSYGVTGYFNSPPALGRKEEKDFSHLDKAQFDIPASDIVVEYDYIGQSRIKVLLDEAVIEELPPSPESWKIRQILVRGVAEGKLRRLVFDNLDYSPGQNQQAVKPKRWAVRDVRVMPLTRSFGVEPGFANLFGSALGMVQAIDKSPEGLFLLIRALQTSAIELLKEVKIDAVGFLVDPGAEHGIDVSKVQDLALRLETIGKASLEPSTSNTAVNELVSAISQLESELWRRVNNRMSQARLSAKIKNYIEAHDYLLSAKSMFPAEADFRWTLANKLFTDNKIVPKAVRQNPERYRR